MKNLLIILFCLCPLMLSAVLPDPVKEFSYEKMKLLQDVLAKDFSTGKSLDSAFELPGLIALSYYPELVGHRIKFQQKNIKTTMQSLPRMDFIFRNRKNRVYKINIDNKVVNSNGLLLKDIPFNAQIGVIGHELGHVVDYSSKSNMRIIFLGIGYLFPGKRRHIENRVDEITIAHGLGNQLKDFSGFVLNDPEMNERYRKYKRKYYYSPAQLLQIMLTYPFY